MSAEKNPLDTSELEREMCVDAMFDGSTAIDDLHLADDDWWDERAQKTFSALRAMHARQERVTHQGLRNELDRRHQLQALEEYVGNLAHALASVSPAMVERLHELATLRRVRFRLMHAVAVANTGSADETATAIEAVLAANDQSNKGESLSLQDAARRSIDNAFRDGRSLRITLGVPCLDEAIGGIDAGNMLVIGAATGVGKSSLALTMALGMQEFFPVGIVSCEDSADVWGSRAAAHYSGISPLRMRTVLTDAEYDRLGELHDSIPNTQIHLEIQIGKNESEVCAAMRRLVHRRGARVLFVDYVQTILSLHPNAKRNDQVRDMAARLKGQAHALGVPLVLVSQLRRPENGEVREPTIHLLKESGDLENAAEAILLLWHPDTKNQDSVALNVGKCKWGCRQRRHLFVRNESGMLVEAPRQFKQSEFSERKPYVD